MSEDKKFIPPEVAIVMITRNSAKHLPAAVEAIIKNTKYPYKLIIVEAESTDVTPALCDHYAAICPLVEVHHIKNEGAIKALNYGLRVSDPRDVYLTHDDVIHPKLYRKDWLAEFVNLTQFDDCGAITAVNGMGESGPDYVDGFKWTGTWSWYIRRSTINKIGYFDENFGTGNGDDIDYSYRIHKAGLKCYIAPVYVEHHRITGQRQIDEEGAEELEKLKQKNAAYFRKKHGIKIKR